MLSQAVASISKKCIVVNYYLYYNFCVFSKEDGNTNNDQYLYKISRENDRIDTKYGFDRVKDNVERTGYLINMHSVS